MVEMEAGTPERIGELNRRLILDYVRKNGPVSRADLHRSLNMSFPTISANVKRMLDGGYLLEAGDGDNSMGRKSTLLRFNAQRAYVVGVDIGRSQIRVILADLEGNELVYLKKTGSTIEKEADYVPLSLCEMIDEALQKASIAPEKLYCICIGVPGIPDMKTGRLTAAPFIHSPDLFDTRSRLQAVYPNAHIEFENSVNYGAVAEKWRGVAKDYKDIVCINYGVGIGAAIIMNGELFRGRNGSAGEIGYMVPETAHLRDCFDDIGVLETVISGKRIGDILKTRDGGEELPPELSPEEALKDRTLRTIIDYMGLVLINISAIFNEEIIVLGGRFGEYLGDMFIPLWKKMLAQHVPFVPEIRTTALGSRADVIGAVAVAIRYVNDSDAF